MEINSVPHGGTMTNLSQTNIEQLLEAELIWWWDEKSMYVYDKHSGSEIEKLLKIYGNKSKQL